MPIRVTAALDDLDEQYRAASELPMSTDIEHAHRAATLAVVCARRAGWWRMLECHAYRDPDTLSVYGHAALLARTHERDAARFWRQSARDWAARAAGDRHGFGLWATGDHLGGGAVA
ncbi:hypothetical protein ACFQE5_05375 [Pseudonocardia hispaniensis]|uniref:Uncharacterized protein n=1 Tax=Pseudonocardia hispaniensis TaxID=904933 RepID=A0ABW1IZ83_9PSEU